jgi:hypothetical protein
MARVCCCCQSTALLPPRSALVSRPLVLHLTTASKRRQLRPPSAIQEHGSEVLAFAAAAALGGPSVARAVYDELVSAVNLMHYNQQALMIAEVRMHQLLEHRALAMMSVSKFPTFCTWWPSAHGLPLCW